jgi:signal transduction histidine kinase
MTDAKGKFIIKDAIETIQKRGSGYIENIYVEDIVNSRNFRQQIAYVKKFGRLNWIIGTAETINDIEYAIKNEILKRVSKMSYSKEGFFSILNLNGTILTHPIYKMGINFLETKDKNLIKAVKKIIIAAKEKKWDECEYNGFKNILCSKKIEDWDWIIFTEFDKKKIKDVIDKKRVELQEKLNDKIRYIGIIFFIFALSAFIFALLLSKNIEKIFFRYKKKIDSKTKALEVLNADLQIQKAQAQEADRAKTVFISNISHDIRTPLNAILGYSQLLLQDKTLGEKQSKKIESILKSGEHLLDLLNDVIEVSKIETGQAKANISSFDLKLFCCNLNELFSKKAEEKNILWILKGCPKKETYVYSDKKKLLRILVNLIENAMKFTHEGEVRMYIKKHKGDRFSFIVSDTGIGIKKEKQKDIFDIFSQTKEGGKVDGKGLGLSIAYKYVQLLGGRLHLRSKPQKGSCFYFSIKMKASFKKKKDSKNELKISYGLNSSTIDEKTKEMIIKSAQIGQIKKIKEAIKEIQNKDTREKLLTYADNFDMNSILNFFKSPLLFYLITNTSYIFYNLAANNFVDISNMA